MANGTFEFIRRNYIDTLTSITFDSNSLTQSNILNWDPTRQYKSDGYSGVGVTTNITYDFGSTQTVDRIVMLGHNLREFSVYYDQTVTNVFTINGADTTTLSYTNNSSTSNYFRCNTVSCRYVTLRQSNTIVSGQEKAIGYFLPSRLLYQFARDPSAKNYKPINKQTQIEHRMADGGTRIQNIAKKWSFSIKLSNIDETFRSNLEAIYERTDSFVFCPQGTSTSWNEIIAECVWPGDFDFNIYDDNAIQAGFAGQIRLAEV